MSNRETLVICFECMDIFDGARFSGTCPHTEPGTALPLPADSRRLELLDDHIMNWRMRAYYAEKWLSRLLGIGLNQVVEEASRRIDHPLGLQEQWQGDIADWEAKNIAILRGAVARLKNILVQFRAGQPCRCADCRGVHIDLDRVPADIEGTKPGESGGYVKVSPDASTV